VSDFGGDRFATGLAITAAVDIVAFAATWVVARRLGRYNIVDVIWGLAILALTGTAFAWSTGTRGDATRRALVLAMTALWAVRLASHIWTRNRGHGEDPRYAKILSKAPGSVPLYAVKRVFVPQALIAFVVSMPLQVAMYQRGSRPMLDVLGAVVFITGLAFETVADAQLARFIHTRSGSHEVMARGLWRYSRHPNYFGESLLWFGLWLPAAGDWRGLLTVLSPVVVTYLVGFATGKPMLERAMAKRKPAYAEYMANTSGFIPLPPRTPRHG
jgi:steroid 5-alpha reductase family enzyme